MIGYEFASRLAAGWLATAAPAPWRELHGTAVLADLSGFTRLTEALHSQGPEGAEVLHRALTLCFSALLAPCLGGGGDIVGFAGDAALVWFDGDDHVRRAVESASQMPANLARLPASLSGGRRLRVSIGVHTGRFTAVLAGAAQRGLFLCGSDVSTLVRLQSDAGPGQIVASDSLASMLPDSWCGAKAGEGVLVRRPGAASKSTAPSADAHPTPIDSTDLSTLVSPLVHRYVGSHHTGDHRMVSVGFLSVPGVHSLLEHEGPRAVHDVLDRVALTVSAIADDASVAWLDTDVGVDSVKFMLTAGAPQSIDDDDRRLLTVLRTILDESVTPLRAGAQRGRVFCGALGVPARQTFTVIGDAVNVAARALGLSADRQLVVGDGFQLDSKSSMSAESLGDFALRNRVKPMPLWRLISITEHADADASTRADVAGRHIERGRLASALKDAADGQGSAVAVVAEAGMGAAELLFDLADSAGPTSSLVVVDHYRRQVPFATVVAIAQSLAQAAGREEGIEWLISFAARLTGNEAGWVAEANGTLRGDIQADAADPVTTYRRTCAVATALIRAAAPRPWLLAIHDVGAIDDASRSVLAALSELATECGWLVVTSNSPNESAIGSVSDTITLSPLTDDEAIELVIAIAPSLRDDQVARILSAGRGNPLVLGELARHPDEPDLPDSLERLGSTRIDALPMSIRQVVRDASAFGTTFRLSTVASVLERPELRDLATWSEAMPVLRPANDDMLVFRHDVYRISAHQSLPFKRRRELHSAIADFLLHRADTSDAVLANHCREAGRSREAFPLTVAAARAAQSTGALVEAADLFGLAVDLAREVDRSALGGLLVEHAEALGRLGDLERAERAFTAAGRLLSDPLAFAEMCSKRASLLLDRGHLRQARTWVRKGLQLTDNTDTFASVRSRLLNDDAAALHYLGRNTESLALATEALELARRAGDRVLEGFAHLHLEMVHSALTDGGAAVHGRAAIDIFQALGHDRFLGLALLNHGLTAMNVGDWRAALGHYRRAATAFERAGSTIDSASVAVNEGFLLLRHGDVGAAGRHAARAGRVFATAGRERLLGYAHHLRSQVAAAEDSFDEAELLMSEAREIFDRIGDQAMVIDCDVTSMDRLLRQKRPADVVGLAHTLERQLAKAEDPIVVQFGLTLARAEALLGDMTRGAKRAAQALDQARRLHLLYEQYRCLAALIDIAHAGGPTAPDRAHEEVAAIATTLGLAPPS